LNSKVKGAAHTLGNVPAEGAEVTLHQAPGLHVTLLNPLACLERGGP
jgi:hypothetical protein